MALVLIILGSATIWLGWYQQDTAQRHLKTKIDQILSDGAKEEQARSILEAIDGVQGTTDTTLVLVRNLSSDTVMPFVARVDTFYVSTEPGELHPVMPRTRLQRVEAKSVLAQDLPSGEKLTQLVFRDRESRVLRDIKIDLKFDKPILSASYQFLGAVVIDQGSRLIPSEDSTRLFFSTSYLSPSNDICINIISRDSLDIQENLSP